MDEIVREFLAEANRHLAQMERDLVTLEGEPANRECLDRVYRALHTIKGNCGFLGFARLEAAAHAGEGLLDALRSGAITLGRARAGALLRLVDACRTRLEEIGARGREGGSDETALVDELGRLKAGEDPGGTAAAPEPAAPSPVTKDREADRSTRVDIGLLDRVTSWVGELVLTRNHLEGPVLAHPDPELRESFRRLDQVTEGLKDASLTTRLQPIASLWGRYPRIVRDLAGACGKSVRLETHGEATLVDRVILDVIRDPLVHLVRNAVDHGLEDPEGRRAAGKPAEGRLAFRAGQHEGQVVFEIEDDGRGIDLERIRRRIVERGLAAEDRAGAMAPDELLETVFLPGFSTSERATSLSGRGVGMDVVKHEVEKIGGSVTVRSDPGVGTTVVIGLPLTLAIQQALVVRIGPVQLAVPAPGVVQIVRVGNGPGLTPVEAVQASRVIRWQGRLIPLAAAADLSWPAGSATDSRRLPERCPIVVLRAHDRVFGLPVDAVVDFQDVMIKPLGRLFREAGLFSGGAVLGDGSLALMLDVVNTARLAQVASHRPAREPADEREKENATEPTVGLLTVRLARGGFGAIPLDRVQRLERLAPASVERLGEMAVTQCRGAVIPLVYVDEVLAGAPQRPPDPARRSSSRSLVVASAGRAAVGLVVDRIMDIERAPLSVRQVADRPGASMTTVVGRRAVELLDVDFLAKAAGVRPLEPLPGAAGEVRR